MTARPAAEPTVGPAGHHPSDQRSGPRPETTLPPDFERARRRLGHTARDAADRLALRLQRAGEMYGLGRPELVAAQRQVRRLRRAGLLPNVAEYWESTAVPRAEILVETSLEAVVEESERVADAIDRFLVATSRSTLEPWINGAEGRAAIQRTGSDAIDGLRAAIPPTDAIDELGEWWQDQLHRRAVLRAAPRILTSRDTAERVIGDVELELLDSPPWCYGDRLLSAFELAHAEIRSRATERADDLSAQVSLRGQGSLVEPRADGPALIKLTG